MNLSSYICLSKKRTPLAVIVFVVAAIYAPVVRNGFVWDDTALVLRDPLIRSWRLIAEGFNHFLFVDATASDFYRPLQRLTYTFEYAGFVFHPAAYHVTNVLLHMGAAIALLFFAEELFLAFGLNESRSRLLAFAGTLIWAVHPLQSAAVTYVAGRADPLAAFFGFSGSFLVLRGLRQLKPRQLLYFGGGGLLFLLSALSKESGLLFPLVAIAMVLLLKKQSAAWKVAVITAFVCAVYFSLRLQADHIPAPSLTKPRPPAMRPITMARAFAEYAGLIVLPVNLHMDRDINASPNRSTESNLSVPAWRELQTLLGVLLIAAAIHWAFSCRKNNRAAFVLLSLAGLTYLPVSGLFALNATVAEHWLYLPSAFFFLGAAAAVASLLERSENFRTARRSLAVVFAVWLVFLGIRTFVRTFDWKDQRTFLERTIAAGGDSARMRINLGGLDLSEGKLDSAKRNLEQALRREPDQPFAVINLAAVAFKDNDFKRAHDLLDHATKMPIVDAQAHELLALLESKEKGTLNPLRLRLAARTGPPNWSIERRYIIVMAETGALEAAILELQTCLQTEWYRGESWQLLGDLLKKMGRDKEAGWAFEEAVAYDVHLNKHQNFL